MARDWMRDRNDLDRNDRQRLRGDWDRDMSRSFSGDTDRDRWTREASPDRDEDRGFMNRYGTERTYGGSMGGSYDRDRMYGGDRAHPDRGHGAFGDFDRDRMGRDRDEGRHLGMFDRNNGGYDRNPGGYDRNPGGQDRTGGLGYGAYGGSGGTGGYGMGTDRNTMGRGDRFDFGDRNRNRMMGRDRMGGYDRGRDEDRGFFQRVGDWFNDMTGTGEDRPRGRGPRNYTRSDDRIRDDVYDRLMDNPWVDSSEVEVRVANAEVTLTGTVPSRHDKRTIEDIAESVLGVKEVHNQLRRQERTQQTATPGTNTTGRTTTTTDNGPRRDLRT